MPLTFKLTLDFTSILRLSNHPCGIKRSDPYSTERRFDYMNLEASARKSRDTIRDSILLKVVLLVHTRLPSASP